MVHGSRAEDGAIQGLMELLHLPYTGTGIGPSAVAMDKERAKQVLAAHEIDVPGGVCLGRHDKSDALRSMTGDKFVVKPNRQGSTVGVTFVESRDDLATAISKAFEYDDQVLVEEWIVGTEISVPVLGQQVMPPVEIVPTSGKYDFESKYLPGATTEICPARLDPKILNAAQELALACHNILECRGCTRTDMIVTGDRIVVLEVNTLPGMTPTSLVPKAADTMGWDFDTLVKNIAEDALASS
jgi:D-alanine--D-alanine ligase